MSFLESIANTAVNTIDRVMLRMTSGMKGYITDYCRFETPLNDSVMVTKDQELLSFIEIQGLLNYVGDEEFVEATHQLELLFNGLLESPKHSLQWVFARTPSQTDAEIHHYMDPLLRAAKAQQLNHDMLKDLIEARFKVLKNYVIPERCILVFATHPEALGTIEKKAQEKEREASKKRQAFRETKTPLYFGEYAQKPCVSLSRQEVIHEAALDTLINKLSDKAVGLRVHLLNCHEALRDVRLFIHSKETDTKWRPYLPGDSVPYREKPMGPGDLDHEFYPSLGTQLFKKSAEILEDVVKIGDDYWATTSVELPAQEPQRFDALFQSLPKNIDWRFSLTILGGDKKFSGKIKTRGSIAKLFKVLNGRNEAIVHACDVLTRIHQEGELLGGIRIQLAVKATSKEKAMQHIHLCARFLQAWGNCDTTFERGDPLDALMATLPGLDSKTTGTTLIQPVLESTILCPITRPLSPWQDFGTNLYRTLDGKIYPIQPCSTEQHTWINLIYALPGSGKSVLQNAQNFNLCLTPGLKKLPKIRILDIGPSSLGLIQILKALLPEHRKGEAVHKTLKQDKQSAINPFDTLLGMRMPHASKFNFIKSFLLLLFTEDGQENVKKGIGELVVTLIKETYKEFSDEHTPKEYEAHIEPEIDSLVQNHPDWFFGDLQKSTRKKRLTWWQIVDVLAEKSLWHEANLAQRQAVPLLSDLTGILHTNQGLKDIYAKTPEDQISYQHLVKMIRSAIDSSPILTRPTQFNLGEARVVALDLADVTGVGSKSDMKRSGLMYMLGREVLLGSLYFNEADLQNLSNLYRHYHLNNIQQELGNIKKVCFDEFHRTGKLSEVREQIEQDLREARKYKVEFSLSSQRDTDFTQTMVELATSIYICNGASGEALNRVCKIFDLNASQRRALKYEVHGPSRDGASFMLKCETKGGRFVQILMNSMSCIELWALASTAEDTLLRQKLTLQVPYFEALKLLAQEFPSGSCKKRVIDLSTETNKTTERIIEDFVEKLVDLNRKHSKL